MSTSDTQTVSKTRGRRFGAAVVALVKLVVAGAVICAIAFAIAVFDGDGSVSPSQADIFDLSFGPKPNQVRFVEALESMGHPEPQVFDLNGNTVYFSANYVDDLPGAAMRRYQEAFVRRGLNDRVYDTIAGVTSDEALETRLTGGISPIEISSTRVVLGGMVTHNIALKPEDLAGELVAIDDMELFRGHRWIEIFRPPDAQQTTVLAIWSDQDFSYQKMLPTDDRYATGRSFDPDVPACPGCTRINHFADKKDRRGYRSNIFLSTMAQDQMVHFYRQAMSQRGWEETDLQQVHQKLRQTIRFEGDAMKKLDFVQDQRNLQIFVYPLDSGEIAVQSVLWEQLE